MKEDSKLNNFTVPDGKTINIDIGDKTVNLLVEDTFKIGSNATVNIIGTGKLNIFVKITYHHWNIRCNKQRPE